jgi:transcriptional regulator with XRE-family HTH domain
MSIAEWDPHAPLDPDIEFEDENDGQEEAAEKPITIPRQLHRLATVRQQQGVSHRNVARRLKLDMKTVRKQEDESSDLPLSMLYAWQQVLDVPIADLLVDSEAPLSAPVMERARLVKLMKTAMAIQEKADTNSMKRLVTMLIEQLVEMMPELKDVGPWHAVGQRRTLDDYGKVVERSVSDDLLRKYLR